ncbi:hypothetical protein MHL39_10680 [Roseomonas mucosa]|uniref:hypothetical protein n=1 Tax=Roseomonas mucosa TaxID=207340 RepID=UPI001EF68CDD|nr:hypothetical protein [Roseomonas mucosa]MCG7357103.1 hypothetical protein [Roseomonas mucosa]
MTLEQLRKIYPDATLNPDIWPDEWNLIASLLNRAELDAQAAEMAAELGITQRPAHAAYFREELDAARKRLSLVRCAMDGLGVFKGGRE